MQKTKAKRTRRAPKGWKKIEPIAISDPGTDLSKLQPGQQAKLVLVTQLLDHDDQRWIDYHDGKPMVRLGGVPSVTDENRTPRIKNER